MSASVNDAGRATMPSMASRQSANPLCCIALEVGPQGIDFVRERLAEISLRGNSRAIEWRVLILTGIATTAGASSSS